MTDCSRGDVVLVELTFGHESGRKLRPALVISSAAFHRARQDVIVAAISSNVTRRLFGDYLLGHWKEAGLLFPSVVTGILRTIKRPMIQRRLGSLPPKAMRDIEHLLRRSLGL